MLALLLLACPVSDLLGPPEEEMGEGPLDLSGVTRSFLSWEIDLIPRDQPAPDTIYPVAEDDPWGYAREVDAAVVQTVPRSRLSNRLGPTEAEDYIFYRGLGTFELPLTVRAGADGEGALVNAGPDALPAVFVLEIRGAEGRFAPLGALGGEDAVDYDLGERPLREKGEVVAALKAAVRAALVDEGLYADEAEAMVKTWSRPRTRPCAFWSGGWST